MEKKILTDMERIANNKAIAEAYISVYDETSVKDGSTYEGWRYAPHATYWSPYFGNGTIDLQENPISVEDSATMEALSYSVEFDDFKPLEFECYPSIEGVAWKTRFGARRKSDGVLMSWFTYSYIHTNEYGEITHWETHVNGAYDAFLDVAIGEHGPYDDANLYMAAVMRKLASAGIDLALRMYSSPALWPKVSFTYLRLFTSHTTTQKSLMQALLSLILWL